LNVDEISLTLPADNAFHGVAHLVLGGLAVRLDLSYEHLEDLELALGALLERTVPDEDVTVRVRVFDDELKTSVGPFRSVHTELESSDQLNLARILATVCDQVDVTDSDGSQWVELTKRIETRKDSVA
jgi:anti-sigma regulatory factor (Ser/Thr protein kinase)